MKFENPVDWYSIETELQRRINCLRRFEHQRDARKLCDNLSKLVTRMSILQVEARRSHSGSTRKVDEQREEIVKELTSLEQWLTMLTLM